MLPVHPSRQARGGPVWVQSRGDPLDEWPYPVWIALLMATDSRGLFLDVSGECLRATPELGGIARSRLAFWGLLRSEALGLPSWSGHRGPSGQEPVPKAVQHIAGARDAPMPAWLWPGDRPLVAQQLQVDRVAAPSSVSSPLSVLCALRGKLLPLLLLLLASAFSALSAVNSCRFFCFFCFFPPP
jgi:hypothetical protein